MKRKNLFKQSLSKDPCSYTAYIDIIILLIRCIMYKVYSESVYPQRAVIFQQKKDIIQLFEEIKIIKSNISLDDCLISFIVFMFDSQVIGLERIRKEAKGSLERGTSQQMYSDSLVHRSGRETNRIDQNRFVIYQHEELRDSILAVFI